MASAFPALEDFTYQGDALSLDEPDLEECKTDLEITTWIVDQLRLREQNNVQTFLANHRVSHTRSDTMTPNHFLIYFQALKRLWVPTKYFKKAQQVVSE